MISDMSPGDKLSLKGKLFELSKKLSIIDFESKRDNQYSFKPEILPYDLPERDENMVNSLRKAEIIRKQRKELLQQSVITNSLEGCTFSPQFVSNSRSRPSVRNDTRPAHERLTQKGKEYREKKVAMQENLKKGYDFDGNKLFTPHLNERLPGGAWISGSGMGTGNGPPNTTVAGEDVFDSTAYFGSSAGSRPQQQLKLNHSQSGSPKGGKHTNTMSADEFLYQDAKDREERHRMRSLDAVMEAESYASTVKTNKKSYDVLRKKAERELQMVFKYLVNCDKTNHHQQQQQQQQSSSSLLEGFVTLGSVQSGSLLLVRSGLQQKNVSKTVFQLLDYHKSGSVSWSDFFTIGLPLVFHQKMNAALADIRQAFSLLSSSFGGHNTSSASTEGFTATVEDLQTLKDWLSHLATALSPAPTHSVAESEPHQPKPNKISLKLAARKAEKDKRQFREINKTKSEESLLLSASAALNGTLDESMMSGNNTEGSAAAAAAAAGVKNAKVAEYNELLSIREKLALERRKQLEEQVLAERMTECTFKPKMPKAVARKKSQTSITGAAVSGEVVSDANNISLSSDMQALLDNSDLSSHAAATGAGDHANADGNYAGPTAQQQHKNVFNKLYSQKLTHQTALADTSSYIVEELKYCTFQPSLAPRKPLVVSQKPIEGFDKSVSRIRNVHQEKIRQKEAEAVQYLEDDLRYRKSRLVAQQGVKPFHFSLEDRRRAAELQQQQHENDVNAAPKLIIEVKLSATKTAKISISSSDVPEELAARFARIYTLEPSMTSVLTEVIRQSMIQNGLLAPEEYPRGDGDGGGEGAVGADHESYESGDGNNSEGDSDGDSEGENSDEGEGDDGEGEGEESEGSEASEYEEESLRDADEDLLDVSMVEAAASAAGAVNHRNGSGGGMNDSSNALELSAQSNDSQDDNDQLELLLMSAHSNISNGVHGAGGSAVEGSLTSLGSFKRASPVYNGSSNNGSSGNGSLLFNNKY